MSEIANLIRELKEHGVGLKVIGDNLEVSLFKDDVDEAIFDQLRAKKPEIIAYINSLEVNFSYAPIPTAESADSYPISAAQNRIWMANKLDADPTVYNLSGRLNLPGTTQVEHFRNAVIATIQRHEILRTVFREEQPGIVRQVIQDASNSTIEVPFQKFEGSAEKLERFLQEEGKKLFDLENGPLLRTGILEMENGGYIFYYNMHHIVSDGWSKEIMARDVFNFYHAYTQNETATIPTLDIQYKDYTLWQLNQASDSEFRQHQAFWTNALSAPLPRIDFTEAKPRPRIKSSNGKLFSTTIDSAMTQKLKQYVETNGGTLFMGLLAIWKVLIHRYTGVEDLIIATPTAGREHPQLKDQIGFYANTLALRNSIDPTETFDELFQRIKESTFDSFEHQSYPFDKLVEDLGVEKDASRNAIFDIMLTLQNVADEIEEEEVEGIGSDEILDFGYSASKFDIELGLQEIGNRLSFQLVFNTDLFEDDFIKRFMNHFKSLVNAITDRPSEKVNSIEFLTHDDLHQLKVDFRGETIDRESGQNVLDLFDQQVTRVPNEPALLFYGANEEEKVLTYRELDEASNQLCHYLHETYELKSEELIALKLERSEWMFVAILAILKAGCAYVPIDMSYPQKRIEYMELNANCKVS
ncbi:MAG: condensation domain-containing protein, partial [Crocinitomicaceae bacterium]